MKAKKKKQKQKLNFNNQLTVYWIYLFDLFFSTTCCPSRGRGREFCSNISFVSFTPCNNFLFWLNLISDLWTLKRPRSHRKPDKIYVNGYRFVTASQSNTTVYLKCANFRGKCKARASQRKITQEIFVTKGEHAETCQPDETLKIEWANVENKWLIFYLHFFSLIIRHT